MLFGKNALKRRYMNESGEGSGGGGQTAEEIAAAQAAAEAAAALAAGEKKPTDAEAKLLKESMQRKEKLEKLTKEFDAAKALLAQLDELGGLDAVKGLVAEKKDTETKQLEAKGEWTRLRDRMAEEHTRAQKEAEDKLTAAVAAQKTLESQINELTIGSSFAGSSFIKDDLVLTPSKTRVLYGDHFDLVEGKIVGYDKPRGSSSRTPLVDANGTAHSFDVALKKIVEADPDKDSITRSKIKPGAGSDTRKAQSGNKASDTEMSSVDRIALGLSKLGK